LGGVDVPFRVPPLVKDSFLITALCAAVFTFPVAFLLWVGGGKVLPLAEEALGSSLSIPPVLVFVLALAVAVLPPITMSMSKTSRFIVDCIRWYVDRGEDESARKLAASLSQQIWFREWKRNPWFRGFANRSGLLERSARLRRFAKRVE